MLSSSSKVAIDAKQQQHNMVAPPPSSHRVHPAVHPCRAADRPEGTADVTAAGSPLEDDTQQPVEPHIQQAPPPPPPSAAAAVHDASQPPPTQSSGVEAAAAQEQQPSQQQPAAEAQQEAKSQGSSDGDADEDDDEEAQPANLDELVAALERKLALEGGSNEATADLLRRLKREPVLPSLDLAGVADLIKSGKARRIIVMTGAGVSVSAGIPDFRTPGTGLYSQLERFGLPEPEAVFSIGFFRRNPKPFHLLAKELFPGNYQPTPTHHFIKLLHDKGLLLRCFTQNIDSLEHQAGLPSTAVVAAHGNFDSAHCIKCGREHSLEHVKEAVFSDSICHCTKCGSYVKPDIVFFGEQLPDRFYERMEYDFPTCDLLLVMGTSLVVHPFASLVDAVPDSCPRVLINRQRLGEGMGGGLFGGLLGFGGGGGFVFEGSEGAYRDVLYLGDADDGVRELAGLLGWGEELEALVAAGGISGSPDPVVKQASSSKSDSTQEKAGVGAALEASASSTSTSTGASGQQDSSSSTTEGSSSSRGAITGYSVTPAGSSLPVDAASEAAASQQEGGSSSSSASATAPADATSREEADGGDSHGGGGGGAGGGEPPRSKV